MVGMRARHDGMPTLGRSRDVAALAGVRVRRGSLVFVDELAAKREIGARHGQSVSEKVITSDPGA